MTTPPNDGSDALREAAVPLAVCTHKWDKYGYGSPLIYTCLDREIDIANPDHPTRDWWPHQGVCAGCELARALGRVGKGTLTPEEFAAEMRENHDRREYERLKAKYEGRPSQKTAQEASHE